MKTEGRRRAASACAARQDTGSQKTEPSEWHRKATRHSCGAIGHIKANCPKNTTSTDSTPGEGDSRVPVPLAQIRELTSCIEKKRPKAGCIAEVCGATPAAYTNRAKPEARCVVSHQPPPQDEASPTALRCNCQHGGCQSKRWHLDIDVSAAPIATACGIGEQAPFGLTYINTPVSTIFVILQ